jgi:hypothetical protein
MPKKKHTPEEIISKLRQVDVLVAQGQSIATAVKAISVSEQSLRDELLDREIFYSLREAQILIEAWRVHYNQVRPHSSLGYRPPAPDVRLGPAPGPDRSSWPGIVGVALNPPLH